MVGFLRNAGEFGRRHRTVRANDHAGAAAVGAITFRSFKQLAIAWPIVAV
jgi:hypothetical protein